MPSTVATEKPDPEPPPIARPRILPVILSGGAGTRLWPMSTEAAPKQFHAFGQGENGRAMLQLTAQRVTGSEPVEFLPPVVICNAAHGGLVRDQLRAIGVEPLAVVLEPLGRNTAAAAAVAARLAEAQAPGALVLLLPADHLIADEAAFRGAVLRAAGARERIVTFGIAPTGPETGYGYIQRGAPVAEGVFEVARFAEKPNLETASAYLATGGYDWNAGIFLFAPTVMLEEMAAHRPDILAGASAALDRATERDGDLALDAEAFAATPAEPIDIAVMERTRRAAVAPCDIGWTDIGSWNALWEVGPRDAAGNLLLGSAAAIETSGALVWGQGMPVAVLGMTDVVVVATENGVIVAPRDRAQEVKRLVDAVKSQSKALRP